MFTITCCIAHLLCSCKKEAFGSSLGIITESNPLPKASKADTLLSLYTLPHSAILTHFAPRVNWGQPYCKAGLTLLHNLGSTRVHPTFAGPCERGISARAGGLPHHCNRDCSVDSAWPSTGKSPTVHTNWIAQPSGAWIEPPVDLVSRSDGTLWLYCVEWESVGSTGRTVKCATGAACNYSTATPSVFKFGLPESIVSKNGPEFVAEEFQQFCQANGICYVKVAPYHPSSNGLTERGVQVFKQGFYNTPFTCASKPGWTWVNAFTRTT